MIAVRAKSSSEGQEFGDLDSSDESVNDEMPETLSVSKSKCSLQEEKLTDSDREILSSMQELKNHSWKPVDSLVASLGKGTNRKSAMKGSRSNRLTSSSSKREVSFHTVVIREYGMTLGDNPSCSYGPPVCLDWDYEETKKVKLDEYEQSRNKRRTMRQMVLSYYKRFEILQNAGYSSGEMKAATRQVNKAKRQRDTTKFFMPVMGVESVVRSAGRKVKRVTGGPKKE